MRKKNIFRRRIRNGTRKKHERRLRQFLAREEGPTVNVRAYKMRLFKSLEDFSHVLMAWEEAVGPLPPEVTDTIAELARGNLGILGLPVDERLLPEAGDWSCARCRGMTEASND